MMQARMSNDRAAVIAAKTLLGEAGPVWWDDGVADCSGHPPPQTPYAEWWLSLTEQEREKGNASSDTRKRQR